MAKWKEVDGPIVPPAEMTLRDWFAGQASEDDVDQYLDYYLDEYGALVPRRTREQAKYAYADAMMEARK